MILFVSGIDTGVGKTVATGLLGRWYARQGFTVATMKPVQTGCGGRPEDILQHRRLMDAGLLPEDVNGLTCPYLFRFPGSPHLAAALERRRIIPHRIIEAVRLLAQRYDVVLVEGAGGLCVPLTRAVTMLDVVAQERWPVALVTSPRLGSINHTLLSLEALRQRRVPLAAVLYNLRARSRPEIVADTRRAIAHALRRLGFRAPVTDLPALATRPGAALPGFHRLPRPPKPCQRRSA